MKIKVLILFAVIFSACTRNNNQPLSEVRNLNKGWFMISSGKLSSADDQSVSKDVADSSAWYRAVVPGTVLGSLVSTGVVEDPYFGVNMQKVDPEQFKKPWWYRSTFELSEKDLERQLSLRFNGINYRADLWINGKLVAGKDSFAGTFRMFTFRINDYVKKGSNTIALKIWQYADGEYSIGFVDWNPWPRDRNMGIFREVFLELNEGIRIRSPFVWAKLRNGKDADLNIQAEIINSLDKPVEGIVVADFQLGKVEKKVKVNAGETLTCTFSPEEFKALSVNNPELWWPNGMGKPSMYNIKVDFISGNRILDRVEKKYGIREVKSYLDKRENRVFEVNGRFVMPKGGGWTDDLLLMDTKESVEAQLRYVRHMNLNSIRCEGFWGKDETLYDLCDEYGILVMIGWSCHWEWEDYLLKPVDPKYGGPTSDEDIKLISAYWFDQMMWLRNHPSIYCWMLGSDMLPAPALEKNYREMFSKYDPTRPVASSAGGVGSGEDGVVTKSPLVSDLTGPTGMKMLGPYAFTTPVYWFTDSIRGGAWGFNSETGPGESIPPLASLEKMFPEKSLWPIDRKIWEFHMGRNEFISLDRFINGLNARYGVSKGIEEFALKSQVSNYELHRSMFEAYIANKPKSTGLVQWKLNAAWPELLWQLYDTYLQPGGTFYGTRKGCTPLHAIYRYGYDDIYLANEDLSDADSLTLDIKVYDTGSNVLFSDKWQGGIKSNTSGKVYKMPEIKGLTPTYFLYLRIFDKKGAELDNGVYWISLKKDIPDYKAAYKLPWPYYTPLKQYADFTALNNLPVAKLEYDYTFAKDEKFGNITLKVKNPGKKLAFFVYLDPTDTKTGKPILPIFWSDNYITLFPGEERTFTAKYFLRDASEGKPQINVTGYNLEKLVLK